MSQKGWRKSEPVVVAGETPRQFNRLLEANLEAGLTHEDLAKLLFVNKQGLLKMLADCAAPKFEDQGVRLQLVR
jgi:hypothetical protein